MRELDLTAFLQIGFRATRPDADVLAAEQALRLDAGVAVFGNLVVLRIDAQRHRGLVILRVEADALHFPDAHAGHTNGRTGLEIPDIVELGRDVIAGLGAAELETAARELRGEEEQGGEAEQHEQAGADFQGAIGAHGTYAFTAKPR